MENLWEIVGQNIKMHVNWVIIGKSAEMSSSLKILEKLNCIHFRVKINLIFMSISSFRGNAKV